MSEKAEVYSSGPFCCSVCAPLDMPADEVEASVNAANPAGTERGWKISEDKFFSDGKTENGGVALCGRGYTRHWLLDC